MASTSNFVHVLIAILVSVLVGMFVTLILGLRELMAGRSLLPRGSVRDVPWKGLDVLGVVLLWGVVNLVVAFVLIGGKAKDPAEKAKPAVAEASKDLPASPTKKGEPPRRSLFEPMLAMTCINAIMVGLIPFFLRLSSGASLAQIGFSTKDLARNLQLGFLTFLFATPFVYVVFSLAQLIWKSNKHPIELMMMKEMSPGVALLAFLSAVVFAPLAEELLFRSVLQGWLTRWFRTLNRPRAVFISEGIEPNRLWDRTLGFPADSAGFETGKEPELLESSNKRPEFLAIAMTSAIFAIMHAPQMPAPVPLFALSMVLGALMERTGSLVPSMVVHALFNGFSMLGLLIRSLSPES